MAEATEGRDALAPAALGSLRGEKPVGGMSVSALWTLLWMELDRQCRAKRILVILFLFALPIVIAVLSHMRGDENYRASEVEFQLVFMFIPHALVPLAALLYASGMIQDEIEDQTLTYLLIRPLPRWSIYVCKLAATYLLLALVVGIFVLATELAVQWGTTPLAGSATPRRAMAIVGLISLALWSYCAIFGCLSLFVRRMLVLGVVYIILFEGFLASIDFIVRRLTVMYSFRVLCERWLELDRPEWSINLESAPDALTCVLSLLLAGVVATAIAAFAFSVREFRVKTPEGN